MTAKDTPGRLHVPPSRASKNRKKPKNSEALKAIWKDPERRASMIEKIKAGRAIQQIEREANPDKFSRAGIPHGHTRASVAPLIAKANEQADRFIQKMKEEGNLPEVVIPGSDEERAEAALREACVIALSPGERQAKMAAIRTVLEWTRAKPASASKITVNTSEDWLAEIAADDAKRS